MCRVFPTTLITCNAYVVAIRCERYMFTMYHVTASIDITWKTGCICNIFFRRTHVTKFFTILYEISETADICVCFYLNFF